VCEELVQQRLLPFLQGVPAKGRLTSCRRAISANCNSFARRLLFEISEPRGRKKLAKATANFDPAQKNILEDFLTLFTVGGYQGDSYHHPWLTGEESRDFAGLTRRWLKVWGSIVTPSP